MFGLIIVLVHVHQNTTSCKNNSTCLLNFGIVWGSFWDRVGVCWGYLFNHCCTLPIKLHCKVLPKPTAVKQLCFLTVPPEFMSSMLSIVNQSCCVIEFAPHP